MLWADEFACDGNSHIGWQPDEGATVDEHANTVDAQEELVLRIWDGDEAAKGELVMQAAPAVLAIIAMNYPRLDEATVEDVVSEAIVQFWAWRANYDPEKASLQTCIYRIADHVAIELVTGRRKWQKARKKEAGGDAYRPDLVEKKHLIDTALDEIEAKKSPLLQNLAEAFTKLSPVERDIWWAFAKAASNDHELDAGGLGIELGRIHNGGVPYPAGTIRTYKSRAKQRLQLEMKRRGFNLQSIGIPDDQP